MFTTKTDSNFKIEVPIKFRNFTIVENIGIGIFSAVVKVKDEKTCQHFAAKFYSKKDLNEQNQTKVVSNEINILKLLDHTNIVKLYDVFEIKNEKSDEFVVLIEEFCKNGNLFDYANKYGFKNENEKRKIAKEITSAIKYIHEKRIAHCDIKPENILLDDNFSPKLCDFGLSKNFNDKVVDETKCGSLCYAAPEIFRSSIINYFKTDIWSLGITLYAISERFLPFKSVADVKKGHLFIKTNNKQLKILFKKCTRINPARRPNADDLLNEDYFSINDNNLFVNDNEMIYTMKTNSFRRFKSFALNNPNKHKEDDLLKSFDEC